jgi:hypothetical protein
MYTWNYQKNSKNKINFTIKMAKRKSNKSPVNRTPRKLTKVSKPSFPTSHECSIGVILHGELMPTQFILPYNVNLISFAIETELCIRPEPVWEMLHKNVHSLRGITELLMRPEYNNIRPRFGIWENGSVIYDHLLNIKPDDNWRVGVFYREPLSTKISFGTETSEFVRSPRHEEIHEIPVTGEFRLSDFVFSASENYKDSGMFVNIFLWSCRERKDKISRLSIGRTLIPVKFMSYYGMNVRLTIQDGIREYILYYLQGTAYVSVQMDTNNNLKIETFTSNKQAIFMSLYTLLSFIIETFHESQPTKKIALQVYTEDIITLNPSVVDTVLEQIGFEEDFGRFVYTAPALIQ